MGLIFSKRVVASSKLAVSLSKEGEKDLLIDGVRFRAGVHLGYSEKYIANEDSAPYRQAVVLLAQDGSLFEVDATGDGWKP